MRTNEEGDQESENLWYKDLLDLVEEDMRPPLDIEFPGVSGEIWDNANVKEIQEKYWKISSCQVIVLTRNVVSNFRNL